MHNGVTKQISTKNYINRLLEVQNHLGLCERKTENIIRTTATVLTYTNSDILSVAFSGMFSLPILSYNYTNKLPT